MTETLAMTALVPDRIGDLVNAFDTYEPLTLTWYRTESRIVSADRNVYRVRILTFAPYTLRLECDVVRTAAGDFYLASNGQRYESVTSAGRALLALHVAAITDGRKAAR